MSEAGVTVREVARLLGISRSKVEYHRLSAGILNTKISPIRRDYKRGGVVVRPYTSSEDARLEAMRIDGASLAQIGAEIGRHPSSVFMRLKTLARRQEAEAA
jgi:DNA-binding CsgD family transcriptional regulator